VAKAVFIIFIQNPHKLWGKRKGKFPHKLRGFFLNPMGHHRYIMDKCGKDADKAFFYVRKTLENNWSRAVLLNWLDTDFYSREGRAITNFSDRLPVAQ